MSFCDGFTIKVSKRTRDEHVSGLDSCEAGDLN